MDIPQPPHSIEPAPSGMSEIPPEWVKEIGRLDPDSVAYRDMASAILDLTGAEVGLGKVTDQSPGEVAPPALTLPDGYKSMELLPGYRAQLPRTQFEGIIHTLATPQRIIEVEVAELMTDGGQRVRICDLRPLMTNSVRKAGPENKADARRLDLQILRDLRGVLETGVRRNTITGNGKVNYSKGSKKDRAYWMMVEDRGNKDHVPTIARLADCGSATEQRALYKTMFGQVIQSVN